VSEGSLTLDAETTALVVIDLQRGIVARQAAPHSAAEVVERSARLADAFRAAGAFVVLVHVAFAADKRDMLSPPVDSPNPPAQLPPEWSQIVPELGPRDGDLVVTKHQWGAFYGTELDLQLRRRGIRTIVLCGIATNFGVESTARDAWERNYALVFAEDAMSGLAEGAHAFAISTIFPRLGRVRKTSDVLAGITKK
jgi:nicotinamidase-related amidase